MSQALVPQQVLEAADFPSLVRETSPPSGVDVEYVWKLLALCVLDQWSNMCHFPILQALIVYSPHFQQPLHSERGPLVIDVAINFNMGHYVTGGITSRHVITTKEEVVSVFV